jgi:tetratricopeptide (TPR) repeat protein
MDQFEIIFYTSLLSLIIATFSRWIGDRIEKIRKNNAYNKNIDRIIGISFFCFFISVTILLWHSHNYVEPTLPIGIDSESKSLKAAWNNKGYALYKLGDYKEAIKCYDSATHIDLNYALAWSNKGEALRALHRDNEAKAAFTKARDLINNKS